MDFQWIFSVFLGVTCAIIGQIDGTELDFTIDIEPGKRECMYQTIGAGVTYEVEYQVIDGGELDVNFVIQAPSGRVLTTDIRKGDNIHQGETEEDGDYSFCIDNTFSSFSNKVVFFELVVDDGNEKDDDENFDENFDYNSMYEVKLEDFKDYFSKMKSNLEKSITHQKSMRAVETRSRSIAEHNFERVNFWSSVLLFVMVSVSLVHVLMIRGLFEDKSKVGKIMKMAT